MIKVKIRERVLEIELGTFREARNLQDAILNELKINRIDIKTELDVNFIKSALFGVVSNKDVEASLWPLLSRCLLNRERITEDLFDKDVDSRGYFFEVCYHVALENMKPFMKDLFAKYEHLLSEIIPSLNTESVKTL